MFGDIRKIGKRGGNVRNGRTYHPQKLARQSKALERQEFRSKLTPAQQIAELDLRLGKGVGAVKERARLAKAMVAPTVKPEPKRLTQEEKAAKKDTYNKSKVAFVKFANLK